MNSIIDKIILWIYRRFYYDKIKVISPIGKIYEKGDITPEHQVVLDNGTRVDEYVLYDVIDTKYQITKRQFIEITILSTIVLLILSFLIYIF